MIYAILWIVDFDTYGMEGSFPDRTGDPMAKGRIKTSRIFLIWAVLSALCNHAAYYLHIKYVSTISYCLLIVFWILSLKDEIADSYIKKLLQSGGMWMLSLFVFRQIRYDFVMPYTFPHRLMWYCYYLPILITPLLSLMISLSIDNKDRQRTNRRLLPLKIFYALLMVLILTNDLHGLAIKIWYDGGEEHSRMGGLYYLVILWYASLMLASFVITYRKCILSSYKKNWKIPVIIELIGLLLWAWYYIINLGSSPKLNGYNLYNIQEVYVLLYIGFWEALILVGLIPSVSLAKDRNWISESLFGTVEEEILHIRSIMDHIRSKSGDIFRNGMIRIAFIGIYIKRRANLELITPKNGYLSTRELSLAIREAIDYFDFSRVSAGYEESGESVEVPSLLLSAILKLLLNTTCGAKSACYVKLINSRTEDAVSITLTVESDMELFSCSNGIEKIDFPMDTELFSLLGATYDLYEEDDTVKLRLHAAYPLSGSRRAKPLSYHGDPANELSRITSYLSLEEDVLLAKTRIHDSLGRSLLMTKAWLLGSHELTDEMILSEWKRILARMSEAKRTETQTTDTDHEHFISQARNMGVDVVVSGDFPDEECLRDVIDSALNVHITNILRHTTGHTAYIDIEATGTGYVLIFSNDGSRPAGRIVEKGGLKNLRQRIERMGGTMEIESTDRFKMKLTLPG